MTIRTPSGTMIENGVEYNTYPPPHLLIKIMKRCWAEKFVVGGVMRLGCLEIYRRWENKVLGDPNDGEGMFRMEGHPYPTGSINHVYAWCAAQPNVTPKRILELASQSEYDCLVKIHQPITMIQRVKAALPHNGRNSMLHCAEITYNRGEVVDKATLNSQKFHFNVFQKDQRFSEDCEYRISLTDICLKSKRGDYVDLTLGNCTDIMSIENLPIAP